jgi:hypothetical protein
MGARNQGEGELQPVSVVDFVGDRSSLSFLCLFVSEWWHSENSDSRIHP